MKLQKGWYELLSEIINSPIGKNLKTFLAEQRSNHQIYPPEQSVFRAFALTPPEMTRVIIIGQDPYHRPGQADGLAFSVPKGVQMPPSLRNIFEELRSDLSIPFPTHGCLDSWAKQGVLLLNTTLTVREGMPTSHHGQGWELFTDRVIERMSGLRRCIYVLWGKNAQQKIGKIGSDNFILSAGHPSPYSAKTFFGCRHFSKINSKLTLWGEKAIDWQI